jgi:ribonuclease Y
MADGRIHPGRIEEVVRKAEQELTVIGTTASARFWSSASPAASGAGRLVGMLRYRYSYAQNVLMHSIECAFIAGAMARGARPQRQQARRAGLLHDIGRP